MGVGQCASILAQRCGWCVCVCVVEVQRPRAGDVRTRALEVRVARCQWIGNCKGGS